MENELNSIGCEFSITGSRKGVLIESICYNYEERLSKVAAEDYSADVIMTESYCGELCLTPEKRFTT